MATTITYKGNTIASLGDNGTKTLLTQRKYLEGNVVVDNVKTYTATLRRNGDSSLAYVIYPGSSGTKYYTSGDTFTFNEGDTLYCYAYPFGDGNSSIYVNGSKVASSSYSYSLPANDIAISFSVTKSRTGDTDTYVNTTSQEVVQSNRQHTIIEGSATIGPTAQFTAMSQVVVNTKSGTAGTPTATKGTASNNSVTVTPSVTNTTGWITGSTITGTDVTVSADELVSGTLSIDDDGTYDVTNYASADVAIDYVNKTLPLTIVNHASIPVIGSLSSFVSSVISEYSGYGTYVKNLSSGIIAANDRGTLRVPAAGFYIRLSSGGNFEVRYNNEVITPEFEKPGSNGNSAVKFYKISSSKCPVPGGCTIDVYSNSDPVKDNVTLDTLSATSNTTYTAPAGTAYSSVTVSVPTPTPSLQSKTAAPTESQLSITADSGYDGLSDVTVEAISSTYVGSGIDRRDSTDLTASGATVTVPAGYYENQASKAISSGSATTAATISGSSATITTSANSITLSKTVSNTPVVSPGYISSGTAGNSDVSLTASVTVDPTPTASGKTVTTPAGYYTTSTTTDVATGSATPAASISGTSATISTGTNTITLSKTVSNTPTVSAGYISSGTAGNSDVSLTASVTTKAAQTYTPGTTDQTITANQYLTGVQTIKGDSNLIASNIAQGVTIFGVQGTHQGGGTPTLQAKTATPSASQQVITADTGYDGLSQVTVSGDSDLIAGNIKSGVNIFGVTGSYTGPSYTDGDNLAYGGN